MSLARLSLIFLGSIPLATPPASRGDDADAAKVIAAARAENRVTDHLDHLSNRIGPRLTGSTGLDTACAWAVDRFKGFGIDNARAERWGEFPVGFDRGPWSGRIVEPSDMAAPLTFNTNSWTAGTKGPARGPALVAPETDEELEAIKPRLAGAWILSAAGGGGRQGTNTNSKFRAKRAEVYETAGVLGVIRGLAGDRIITGGNYQASWDALPKLPAVDLIKPQFDAIAAAARDGKPVVLEFDIRNHFRKGPVALYNVIADIPGTDKADEYVVVGGHIDTWDGATGTTDNGTGCATTLEAARLLVASGVKPRRTIRFMLWSGEEQGLLGSRAYVKAHPELMPRISAVLVHDGGTNYLSGIGATKAMRADLDAVFAPVLDLSTQMPFKVTDVPGLRGGGSDHASFLAAGVPGFFWRQSGKASYPRTHHTQYDTFDAAIPEYQEHSAVVAAVGALGIANLDHLLSREAMTAPPSNNANNAQAGRRRVGVTLDETTVDQVAEGGLAEKAGLKAGDKVTRVDGKPIRTTAEFSEAVQAGGRDVTITVTRNGMPVDLKVTFPEGDARPRD